MPCTGHFQLWLHNKHHSQLLLEPFNELGMHVPQALFWTCLLAIGNNRLMLI
jgi:hypothetical protein